MGWRETLGGAVPNVEPPTQYPQNTQNPPAAREPEPEQVGFGGSGGFGYQGENSNSPQADRTKAGLRLALTAACEGLPLSLEELAREFGAEGEADWLTGDAPHCQPDFLRAFAVAVSERLADERTAEPGANTPTHNPQNTQNPEPDPPTPGPLDGLALLREDRRFIEGRTRGRHREALLSEYARRWKEAAAAEPVEFRKANGGRFAANSWLREVRR